MVSSSDPEVAVARGAIPVLAAGHASGALWASTEDGQATQMAGGLRVAGGLQDGWGHRVARGQERQDSWRAQDWGGPDTAPELHHCLCWGHSGGGTPAIRVGDGQSPAPELPCPYSWGDRSCRSAPSEPSLPPCPEHPAPCAELCPGAEVGSPAPGTVQQRRGECQPGHGCHPPPSPGWQQVPLWGQSWTPALAPAPAALPLQTLTPATPGREQQPSRPGTAGQTQRVGADKPRAPFGLLPDVTHHRPPARHCSAWPSVARCDLARLGTAWQLLRPSCEAHTRSSPGTGAGVTQGQPR